jgi:hypothetical protein
VNVKRLFQSLVESAVNFAEKSLEELKQQNPKHSLINFCTALELFLKARLMLEHWTLVVSNPARANPQTFEQGDFHSVSMDEAIERLENVVGDKFSIQEKKIFGVIREQRNRMIHFFDPVSATKRNKNVERVAAQEYSGWYYLHLILTGRWKKEFKIVQKTINDLGRDLHQLRGFLRVKFEALGPSIAQEKEKGVRHRRCTRCRFPAYRPVAEQSSPPGSSLLTASCMVCELSEVFMEVKCPECSRTITIRDMGEAECTCGFKVDPEWLVEELGPRNDPKEDPDTAYCTECEQTELETVIPLSDEGGYICVSCFCTFSTIGECGFCSSRNAGEISSVDSYLSGCLMCEGMVAQDNT